MIVHTFITIGHFIKCAHYLRAIGRRTGFFLCVHSTTFVSSDLTCERVLGSSKKDIRHCCMVMGQDQQKSFIELISFDSLPQLCISWPLVLYKHAGPA